MKVGDLFKKPIDPALPPVLAAFYPALHDTAREVMSEWKDRAYTFDELVAEVCRRAEAERPKTYPDPPPLCC